MLYLSNFYLSVRFVDTLIQQMDNFNIPISILIDLSKAFNTLDHNIMLSKLRHYGVTGIIFRFFLPAIYLVGFSMLTIQVSALRSFQLVQECPKGLSWGPYYS